MIDMIRHCVVMNALFAIKVGQHLIRISGLREKLPVVAYHPKSPQRLITTAHSLQAQMQVSVVLIVASVAGAGHQVTSLNGNLIN